MSVPEGLRKCGKLKVLVEALDLTDYTLTITANSKVFVPEYKSVLTDKINELVLNIYINLFTANNIVVKSEMDARERHQLQMVAITQCNDLLALIQIAQKVFHLKLKRIKYWAVKLYLLNRLSNLGLELISSDIRRANFDKYGRRLYNRRTCVYVVLTVTTPTIRGM